MKTAAPRAARSSAESETGRATPFFARSASVQAKLRRGRSGDRYEREADAVADAVVHDRGRLAGRGPLAARLTPTVQRSAEDEEAQATPLEAEAGAPMEEEVQSREAEEEVQPREEEDVQLRENEEELQSREDEDLQAREEDEELQARAARPGVQQPRRSLGWVERRLRAARGLGNPLPEDARRRMESRIGAQLSGVRIHTDALAVELTRALRAQAFTHGRDIYFGAGRFAPGTAEGDHLLAHELAHTVQQGGVKATEVQLQEEDPDVMHVRPESLEAIRLARSELGLVNAKQTDGEGNRIGWEHLLAYFRKAFGGDVIHPDVIRRIHLVKKAGASDKQDAMPSWCGIFVWWALKSAGVPIPDWEIGENVLETTEQRPPGTLPRKGDIAYRGHLSHFALVSGLESSAEAAGKPVKSVRVRTINGNTAGSDNLGGQIQELWHPMSNWTAFFDPVANLPMPDVPLVETTREPEDLGPPPPPTEAEEAAAADPGPTDVSHLDEDVPLTPEASAGAEAEVPLDIPPPSPLPPAEAAAPVEKAGLEGSSDQAMASFTGASASSVAATAPEIGGALDAKIAAEQSEAAANAPELHAQTGGDVDPGITPPGSIPVPADATVGDGVQGATPPELVADPHEDRAPPPSNVAAEKEMDRQPEGGFLEWLRGAITNLMQGIRTDDPGVSTSAGPRGRVALEGEADPERMSRQKEEGAGQLRAQRDSSVAAFKNHPGQGNIKPRRIDEARKPELRHEPEARIEPLGPSQGASDYVEAALPKEVRDKADADLAPVLAPGLEEAGRASAEAASTRDDESTREKQSAADRARALNEKADAEQKQIVLDGRKDVAKQQGEGVAQAYEQVSQFSKDAAVEQGAQRKAIGSHVRSEEGKARDTLDQAERDAEKEKRDREAEAAAKKRALEKEQEKESWWDRAASFVKKAVKALTSAIDTIFTKLREAVAALIEKAKKAAVGLINAARSWVIDKLNRFRDWAKSQVDKYLKERFPGLARAINAGIDATVDVAVKGVNLVADAAIAGVEALANELAAALDRILGAFQTALKAAVQIAGAVVTGDFAEALRIAVQAACDIAGIDSGPIFDFFARAGDLITKILKDPLPFINNLMSAVGQGIRSFGENILAHLQKGLIAWLTGALTQAGIQLPEKFDLLGIFGLVAQILGLTYANVKARIIKRVPAAEKVFDVVEKGFALVMKLKDLDFSGLWEEAKAYLSNLKETVIGGIKSWVVTNVIKEGIVWLISLLNPASAIVKALKALFDLAMWLIERFDQIKQFVLSVYDAVSKIAAGVLGPAAKAVEDALSRSLPVVISMVASLIGLGGIGKAVRGVLEKITKPINKVMDKIIDKVAVFVKKLVGKVKKGAKAAKEKIKEFLWPKKKFSVDGESHTLYFDKAGTPMMRSTPQSIRTFLKVYKTRQTKAGYKPSAEQQKAVRQVAQALDRVEVVARKAAKLRSQKKGVPEEMRKELADLWNGVWRPLNRLLEGEDFGVVKERYRLEGATGKYSNLTSPRNDDLEKDHQPQKAALRFVANRPYFRDAEGPGENMRTHAGSPSSDSPRGMTILLHKYRHQAGRTYAKSPVELKAAIRKEEKRVAADQRFKKGNRWPKLRSFAVDQLEKAATRDAGIMLNVYRRNETNKVWRDLDQFVSGKKKTKLVEMIRSQVADGEAVMKRQPWQALKG